MISSQGRYDHFDTLPYCGFQLPEITKDSIPHPAGKIKCFCKKSGGFLLYGKKRPISEQNPIKLQECFFDFRIF